MTRIRNDLSLGVLAGRVDLLDLYIPFCSDVSRLSKSRTGNQLADICIRPNQVWAYFYLDQYGVRDVSARGVRRIHIP